ncbi:MAG TPA: SgcJ/EcaC family oxidoreductase [Pyrinomonadaceae bacterium]|nr:SgcJ/EcaC family oxidoreductase [Pyrinomonadaceae bacterium]
MLNYFDNGVEQPSQKGTERTHLAPDSYRNNPEMLRKSEETTDVDNIRDAIAAAIKTFADAFGRGDAEAIAAWYSTDATLLPPDQRMLKGREAIQAFWQGAMNMGITEAGLETLEVEVRDDLAYEVGRFRMTVQPQGGEAAKVAGKYVVVWKQEGGRWRMHVDIWNADPAS